MLRPFSGISRTVSQKNSLGQSHILKKHEYSTKQNQGSTIYHSTDFPTLKFLNSRNIFKLETGD